MRIALTVDPAIRVPPVHYGGIERIVAFLVEGLVSRGHEVTLFAHPASDTPAELVSYGRPPHRASLDRLRELSQVAGGLLRRRGQFDVVHSFGRLAAVLPMAMAGTPVIQSYQRAITERNIRWANRFAGDRLAFTACSTSCRRNVSQIGQWTTVYNGVRLSDFAYQPIVPSEAPLVFLGRIEQIKGTHTAIQVAKSTDRCLVIAGNVPAEHQLYFDEQVAPHIDGEQVRYVGPVDDVQKNELLGSAAALLMPIEWEEPFGIVMAEALACGTPVIGTRRGSVPEVVEDGVSGFVRNDLSGLIEAVAHIDELDRAAVRRCCEERFSAKVIVDAYERLYRASNELADSN